MTDEHEIMSSFFRGDIAIEEPDLIKAELGYGKGLGNKFGTYKEYINNVQILGNRENPIAYIGKDIKEDIDKISIVDPGNEFREGEVPVILIEYYDLLHSVNIKLNWRGSALDSWSFFDIPAPISMQQHWWDLYYCWFYAPEGLTSGEYKVELYSTELDKKMETMMDEIYFQIT